MKQRIAGWLAPLLILMAGLAFGFIIGKDRGVATIGQAPSTYSAMIAQNDGSLILANEPTMDGKSWGHQVDSSGYLIRQIEVTLQPKEDSVEIERLLKSNKQSIHNAISVHLSIVIKRNGSSEVIASSENADVLYGRQFTGFSAAIKKTKRADALSLFGCTHRPILDLACRLKPYANLTGSSLVTRTAGSGSWRVTPRT